MLCSHFVFSDCPTMNSLKEVSVLSRQQCALSSAVLRFKAVSDKGQLRKLHARFSNGVIGFFVPLQIHGRGVQPSAIVTQTRLPLFGGPPWPGESHNFRFLRQSTKFYVSSRRHLRFTRPFQFATRSGEQRFSGGIVSLTRYPTCRSVRPSSATSR